MYGNVAGVSSAPTFVIPVVTGGTIADQIGADPVIRLPSTGIAPVAAGTHHDWLLAAAVIVLAIWTLFTAARVLPRLLPRQEV